MIKEMSPQDLVDENNELMQENEKLRKEVTYLRERVEREEIRAKCAEYRCISLQDEYLPKIEFYERKHPSLPYEYQQYIEDVSQD